MLRANIDRRTVYFLSLQALSFLLLLIFVMDLDASPYLAILLIVSEIALVGLIGGPFKRTVFLWQFQFFLVFIVGVVFYPVPFFNWSSPPTYALVIMAVGGVAVEVLVALAIFYGERPINIMLKGATVSMIGVVAVIVLLIGSEGLYGFIENDPVEMLTSTEWFPEYNPDVVETTYIGIAVSPYSFTMEEADSAVHAVVGENRTSSLQLEDTGASNDTISLSVATSSPTITATLANSTVTLAQGGSAEVMVDLLATAEGSYTVTLEAEDLGGNKASVVITVIVDDDTAVDFARDSDERSISSTQSNSLSQKVVLDNLGSTEANVSLAIVANESLFRPSLGLAEWSYTSERANVTIDPGSNLTFLLLPGYLVQVQGTYSLTVQAWMDGTLVDEYVFTFEYSYSRILQGQDGFEVSLDPDSTVVRSYQIISSGTPFVHISAVDVPQGLRVYLITNGTEMTDLEEGTTLYLNGTSTDISIAFVTDGSYVDGTDVGLKVTIPGTESSYGMLAYIVGTALTTAIALLIAVPLALGSALFLAEHCPRRLRRPIMSAMEILAGIPSVVYGLWGVLTFGPVLSNYLYPFISSTLGQAIPFLELDGDGTSSILTASIVLGIMILPIILALSYESIAAVPGELKEASYAVGATKWQTSRKVVLKHARSGILAAIVLGMGRAIGETMAVLMIMGSSSGVPDSVYDSVGTMTSIIASSFASSYADAYSRHGLFAVALLLFVFVLVLNIALARISNGSKKGNRWSERLRTVRMLKAATGHIFKRIGSIIPRMTRSVSFRPTSRSRMWDRAATAATVLTAVLVISFVLYIVGDIVVRGGASLTIEYLLEPESGSDADGGFLNAIVGSLGMVLIALLFAVPVSVMAAIYVNEYAKPDGILVRSSMLASSTLASTPSIIFGIFGFMLFIFILDFGFSMLSGGLTLACMMLPLIFVSSVESLKTVPGSYREASQALGATKWGMVRSVVFPVAISGVISGTIVAIGRAIGETAAVLLTAGYLIIVPSSIFSPAASMPNMIYQYYDLVSKMPAYREKLYAVAFVLIIIVIVLNMSAKMIGHISNHISNR